jgi:hypothetical protein
MTQVVTTQVRLDAAPLWDLRTLTRTGLRLVQAHYDG